MKRPCHALLFAGAILTPWIAGADPIELGKEDPLPVIDPLLAPEPTVAVLPTEVSLNGISQPVLGRSLSDSLMGGLVAQGNAKVISYVEALKDEEKPAEDSPPEVLAGMLGRRLGAQKVLVPRLVGEDDFYRYTVKEVDTGNYEVTRVFELSHSGDRDAIFGFVPLVLGELEKDAKRNRNGERVARGEGEGNPVIKIWSWEEFRRDFGAGEIGADGEEGWPPRAERVTRVEPEGEVEPGETRVGHESEEERELAVVEEVRAVGRRVAEMVALGKVTSVNDGWGFCVIDMTGRKLEPAEELEIRLEDSGKVYATLVVKRVEGQKAIADLVDGQRNKRLFPGDVVFGKEIR